MPDFNVKLVTVPVVKAVVVSGPTGPAGNVEDLLNSPSSAPESGGIWTDGGIVMAQGPKLASTIASQATAAAVASQNTLVLSGINHSTSTYTRNANCWITADKTAWPVWNSRSATQSTCGSLISPRHIVLANHTGMQVGDSLRFLTNADAVITRTISAIQNVASDLNVALLNADLPNTISFCKVLPPDFAKFNINPTQIIVGNQFSRLLVNDWTTLSSGQVIHIASTASSLVPVTGTIISGDSGSPAFILLNGSLVLLGTHFGSSNFPLISNWYTEVNAAMTSLGGGYQLTPVDLSGYASYRSATGHTHDLKTINGNDLRGTGDIAVVDANAVKKDGSATFTADQSMGFNKLRQLAAPVIDSDAARLLDVQSVLNRLTASGTFTCVAASQGNLAVGSPVTVVDGVTIGFSNLVFVNQQTNPTENGIYIWFNGSLPMFRAGGTFDQHVGMIVSVTGGTDKNTKWKCTVSPGGTFGTTPINFSPMYVVSQADLAKKLEASDMQAALDAALADIDGGAPDTSYTDTIDGGTP